MNIWTNIANLGVTAEMPIYKQKSTVFFNIVMRAASIMMILIAISMFIFSDLIIIPLGLILGIPISFVSLLLNKSGKVKISVLFLAIIFPFYFIIISIISKSYGEGLSFFYHFAPRMGIIIMSVASFAVIGFHDLKKAFIAIIIGTLALLLFDFFHNIFDVSITKDNTMYASSVLFRYLFAMLFLYIIVIIYSLQRINTHYETIITKQKQELELKNVEIITQNEEIEAQRDEIETQRDEVSEQRDEVISQNNKIQKQNNEITDSIYYAKRIQQAVMPSQEELKMFLPEYFILFKPKNIVSGDFYWFKQIEEFSVIAVADCTGHGVPGAFMSMLGMSFLNELVTKIKLDSPEKILERLRKKIKTTLSQTGKTGEQKDGMDMALLIVNNKTLELQYAGAYNPLYIIENKKVLLEQGNFEKKIILPF